ncbi:MAG: hypothetical protein AAF721_27485 [Myxococcota bacterium]
MTAHRSTLAPLFALLFALLIPAVVRAAPETAEPSASMEPTPEFVAEQDAEEDAEEDVEVDPKEYAALLRAVIDAKRDDVEAAISDRVLAKQAERMSLVSTIFSVVSLLGLAILAMPLVLRRRFPGRAKTLWKYSCLAAALFVITVNLFAGVLSILRVGQMAAGSLTNPQVQIVSATFDVLDDNAEDLADLGPILIEPTLAGLTNGTADPVPVLLLNNVSHLVHELKVFKSVAAFFKRLDWAFGYVPVVLALVTVGVFMVGLRPTLTEIVRLPIRAAAGEEGVARRVVGATLRRVGREFVVTLAVMVVLLAVMLSAGFFLSEALPPALEAFIAYLGVAFIYVQMVPDASTVAVLVALAGTIVFLGLDLAVVLVASATYVGKAHKVLQRRFHDREPLRAHRRFWGIGTLLLGYALAFPLLFILGTQPLIEAVIDWQTSGAEVNWAMLLVSGPVLLVVMFVGAAALFRLHRALGFLARYRVPKLGSAIGCTQPVRSGNTDVQPAVPVRTGSTALQDAVGDEDDSAEWAAALAHATDLQPPTRGAATQPQSTTKRPRTTAYSALRGPFSAVPERAPLPPKRGPR